MMNDLFKKELMEGLMTWILLKIHSDCSAAIAGVLIILGLFPSRLYHAACFGNPGSDSSGCWHSIGSTPKTLFPSFSVSQRFGNEPSPFIDRPPFVQVVNTASSSSLERGMNGSIILGADSSDGARGCP